MRSVVVLPAPLGPSSPVISPSRASKWTPSTARTVPVLVLKLLCRSFAMIMKSVLVGARGSRFPSVEAGERWYVADRIQAFGVELSGIRRFEELADQLGQAAHAADVVTLSAQDEVAAVRQPLEHRFAVRRRCDRIDLARQQQRGHLRSQRLVETRRTLAVRPVPACSKERTGHVRAENRVGIGRI